MYVWQRLLVLAPIDCFRPEGWCCQSCGVCLPDEVVVIIDILKYGVPTEQNIIKNLLPLPNSFQEAAKRIQHLNTLPTPSKEVSDFITVELMPLAERYRDVSYRAMDANSKFHGASRQIADTSLPSIYIYAVAGKWDLALATIREIKEVLSEALDAYTGLRNNVTEIHILTSQKIRASVTKAEILKAEKWGVQPLSNGDKMGLLSICLVSFAIPGVGIPVCGSVLAFGAANDHVVTWDKEYDDLISQFQMVSGNLDNTVKFIEGHRNHLTALISSLENAQRAGKKAETVLYHPLGVLKVYLDSAAEEWRRVGAAIDNYRGLSGPSHPQIA